MTNAIERWLPVVGWEGFYEVSDGGKVRSLRRGVPSGPRGGRVHGGIELVQSWAGGYLQVTLCGNGERKHRRIHHLVAEAFIGPRPPRMDCCHCDGDRENNALGNLRWDTPAGNCADKVKHGTHNRGERHFKAKLTELDVVRIRADTRPPREIAVEYGINPSGVSLIKHRRTWRHIP